jgi:alkylation response protein AidB-like acyl-CoA dehydrogenase
VEIVQVAQGVADDVLFPAALATEASDAVPRELLDALAQAGLYGLPAPASVGGFDADLLTMCAVLEALSSGCLSTAFLWMQHVGLVRALSVTDNAELAARWLGPLARGEIRAGLALGGALPRPALRVQPDGGGGWRLDGVSPFVSGWGLVDVLHVAARTPDDEIAWLLVEVTEGPALRAERIRLAALDATATVRLTFAGLAVPAGRETSLDRPGDRASPEVLRTHAALALGVAARACRLLGPTGLDAELSALRGELDQLGPGTAAARAAAGELALRAASALMTAEGSRSLLVTDHGQRLAREAMFTLVYALRPASREALLTTLGAPERA